MFFVIQFVALLVLALTVYAVNNTNTTSSPSGSYLQLLCRPGNSKKRASCESLKAQCGTLSSSPAPMKWTGRGCRINGVIMNDGGCQCLNYCGYTCKHACNHDQGCLWVGPVNIHQGGKCTFKSTGAVGTSVPTCFGQGNATITQSPVAFRVPTLSPTATARVPTVSPTTTTPTLSPTTTLPTKSPTASAPTAFGR
jgi:hypothetical protein